MFLVRLHDGVCVERGGLICLRVARQVGRSVLSACASCGMLVSDCKGRVVVCQWCYSRITKVLRITVGGIWGSGLTCSQIQPKPQVCVQMCDSKCSRARVRCFAPFCLHLAQSVCTALIIRRFGSVGNCTFSVHWCLHLSALVCTAAVAVQMVQAGGENGCATRVSRHRGSGRPIGATENPLPLCRFPLCYHSARWLCTSACADGSVGELQCCLH